MTVWLDGAPCMEDQRLTRARRYGDGVFRTLLKKDKQIIDIDSQFEILKADAGALDLAAGSCAQWQAESLAASAGLDDAVLRWTLLRAPGRRGYHPDGTAAHRLVESEALPARPRALWREGVRVQHAGLALAVQPRLAGIKHLNRLEQVMASRDWAPGVDEALMCSLEGHLVCGTRSNLFWWAQGRWHTPALDRCGVNGQLRRKLLAMAATHAETVDIVRAGPEALDQAEELLLCNSLIGIWPVRALAARRWPAPGPQTARWIARLGHPWQGQA
jgi:4-amino-4-deoxychorismate lyase